MTHLRHYRSHTPMRDFFGLRVLPMSDEDALFWRLRKERQQQGGNAG